MLDNRYALLFIRGERPIADEKYNLLKHPNIGQTPDGDGKPYRHDGLDALPNDVSFDVHRPEDYLLLDGDEFAHTLANTEKSNETEQQKPNPFDSEKE